MYWEIYDTLEGRFLTDSDLDFDDFDRFNAGCRGGVEVEKHHPSGGDLSSARAVRSEFGVRLSGEFTPPLHQVGWQHTVRVIPRMAFDCR